MICKMNVSFYLISLIFVCNVSMISSQNETQTTNSKKDVGPISCYYFGTLDVSCNQEVVPISNLPTECMAYFHDGLTVDMTLNVKHAFMEKNQEMLDTLLTSGKPVYVRYGHTTIGEWTQLFGCDVCTETNAVDEMIGVKAYLDKHKGIAGLVLTGLIQTVIVGAPLDLTIFPNLSESLKTYITVMKRTFPDLQVGISFPAWFFVYYYEHPEMQQVPWWDFAVLDEVVDFYEISANCLNSDCTEELKHTGITPMNGNAEYTLEKVEHYIEQMKIPKEKIHYRYQLAVASPDFNIDSCLLSFKEVCMRPDLTQDWCADTLATLYEKGVFAKQKGNGVIVSFIDFDDIYGCCCGIPFPAFHAIVNGFNCAEPPKPCPLFDRS